MKIGKIYNNNIHKIIINYFFAKRKTQLNQGFVINFK